MKTKYFISTILIIVLLQLVLTSSVKAAAISPYFGGQVIMIRPCNSGLLLEVRPPIGPNLTLMWLTGNLPYLMRIPPHPSQNLLGMASPAPVPCVVGNVTVGNGRPIIFHGSSI